MSPMMDRRGSVGVLAAMTLAVLAGIGGLAVNQVNQHYRGLLQRQTTQASALAAAAKISTYYASAPPPPSPSPQVLTSPLTRGQPLPPPRAMSHVRRCHTASSAGSPGTRT